MDRKCSYLQIKSNKIMKPIGKSGVARAIAHWAGSNTFGPMPKMELLHTLRPNTTNTSSSLSQNELV